MFLRHICKCFRFWNEKKPDAQSKSTVCHIQENHIEICRRRKFNFCVNWKMARLIDDIKPTFRACESNEKLNVRRHFLALMAMSTDSQHKIHFSIRCDTKANQCRKFARLNYYLFTLLASCAAEWRAIINIICHIFAIHFGPCKALCLCIG